jgi:hypothetical protein
MSCGQFKCALRRFDGHGTNSYRPTNSESAKQMDNSLQAMLAERARQDAGIFHISVPSQTIPATSVQTQNMPLPKKKE